MIPQTTIPLTTQHNTTIMKAFSTKTAFPIFLASCKLAPVVSQATVTCTKSKNDGGILLYGNFDWVGGK